MSSSFHFALADFSTRLQNEGNAMVVSPRQWFHFRGYCRFNLNSVSGIELQFSCNFDTFSVEETKQLFLLTLLYNYSLFAFVSVMEFTTSLRVELRWINRVNIE